VNNEKESVINRAQDGAPIPVKSYCVLLFKKVVKLSNLNLGLVMPSSG